MSDEMMVQNKRPSAVPYLLAGAAVGGGAGAGLAKLANFGLKGQYADNAEEAIAKARQEMIEKTNADDRFVTKMAKKEGEEAKSWKVIQDQTEAVRNAEIEVENYLGKDLKDSSEVKELTSKLDEVEKSQNSLLGKFAKGEKIGEGEEAKSLFDLLTKEEHATNVDEILADVKSNGSKELKETKFNVKGTAKELQNITAEDLRSMTEEEFKAVKDSAEVKKFFEKSDAVKKFGREQDAYKKIYNDAETKINELLGKVVAKKTDFSPCQYMDLRGKVTAAKDKAGKAIGEDVLKACKEVKWGKTAAVGAAGAAVLALIIRACSKPKDNA